MLLLLGAGLLLVAAIVGCAARAPAEKAKLAASTQKPINQGGSVAPAIPRPPAQVQLSDGWRYLADPHNLGIAEDWGRGGAANQPWTPVAIPNDFNPTVSSTSDSAAVGWYEVAFKGPPITSGRSWRVAFEGVRRNAEVWLNGYELGTNSDPYAPFSLPATSLIPDGENLLVVRVDNVRGRGSLPEDWWDWGGIMGPVSLQPAGRLSLNDLGVLPELHCSYHCGDMQVQGTLHNNSNASLNPDVVVKVTPPSGASWSYRQRQRRLASGTSTAVSFRVPVHGRPALWSPDNPLLYRVEVKTVVGNRVEDDDTVQTGMRSVQVRGGTLYLNGRRLWLHGAAIHEDIDGRGAALADGDIDTIVSELRSVGANVTRAHYLLSPRLLDALDQAGIMVWAQPPVDHADGALKSAAGRRRALSALRSTLIGDRSHPSVIVDSVGNELTPTPDRSPGTRAYLQQAIALARQLNPGVPVALDTYCYPGFPAQKIYSKLNVLGISSYFGWYPGLARHSIANFNGLQPFLRQSHARYPKLALVVSEFGAESLFDGPQQQKGTYAFQSNYVQQTLGVVDRLPFMNGAIYWTLREFAVSPGWTGGVTLPAGATPDGLHHKGLIAYDGTEKPAFAVAQKLFGTQPSFVH
jgi:Glycosyl hydrolases family 2, TIM barrel domain/Glycosyl hydrolases family 2, sugar binding domain/Glycosyl hydrolases family 2